MVWCSELFHDVNGILRCFLQADRDHRVHSGRVALVTDIVALDTACQGTDLLVAEEAFHQGLFLQILQRRSADQALFVHIFLHPFSKVTISL